MDTPSSPEPARPSASRRRLTPIAPWPATDTLAAHLRAEQVRVIYSQAVPAQLISIVAVAVVCFVLRDVTARGPLIVWFAMITIITVGRIALALTFRRRNPQASAMRSWEVAFIVSLALISLAWGVGGWLVLPPSSPIHQALVYFFLMGIAGGAVASYSAHALASAVSVCSLMVPATIYFAFHELEPLRAMAIGGVLYLAAAMRSTRSFGFFLRRTFQLQFELHQGFTDASQQARTDELTGLANRRAFLEQGKAALEQATRYGRPLALVMFDIDHFKRINDTFGHAVGDEALRFVAVVLRRAARVTDTCGRLGGEEFAVLLPETAAADAEVLAERLRRDVAAIAFSHGGQAIRFTCSFGVVARGEGATLDALLGAADAALYRAKSAGRDRVVRSA